MITVDTLLQNPELRKGSNWRGAVTHCKWGHEYTERNTVRDDLGNRACRTCRNNVAVAINRQRRARERAQRGAS